MAAVIVIMVVVLLLGETALGFLRGWKKSVIRVGVLFAVGLCLYFIAPAVSESFTLWIMSFAGLNYESFEAFITELLSKSEMLSQLTFMSRTLSVFMLSASIPFVYVVLYWVVKLITWPIYAIVAAVIEKKTAPEHTAKAMNDRLIGAAVGLVAAIICGAFTFAPVINLTEAIKDSGEADTLYEFVDSSTDAEVNSEELINCYADNGARYVFKYTGTEFVTGKLSASTADVESDGEVYVFTEEVGSIIKLLPYIKTFTAENASLDDIIVAVRELKTTLVDTRYFSTEEKVAIINAVVNEVKNSGMADGGMLGDILDSYNFDDLDVANNDIERTLEVVEYMNTIGVIDTATNKINEKAVISKTDVDYIVDKFYEMSDPEVKMNSIISTYASSATNGMVTSLFVTDVTGIENPKENATAVFYTLVDVLDMTRDKITADEKNVIFQMLDAMQDNPLVDKDGFNKLYKYAESLVK